MQALKAIYKGKNLVELLEKVNLPEGAKLTVNIPEEWETELGQDLIESLTDAVEGKVRIIKSSKDILSD